MTNCQKHFNEGMQVTLIAMVILVGFTISTVGAADRKIYPGWMCKSNAGMDDTRLSRTWNGAIGNSNESTPLRVSCPILRDYIHGPEKNLRIEQVRVYYEDNNLAGSVECDLNLNDWRPGTPKETETRASPLNDTAKHYLFLGRLESDANHWPSSDNYEIRCSIPPKTSRGLSVIFGYSVLEKD